MPRKNLTDRTVAALHPPTSGQVDWYDAKNPRFGIRLSYNGTRTWFLFDKDLQTGKRRRVTLGRYPEVKLADARKLALGHKHALTVDMPSPSRGWRIPTSSNTPRRTSAAGRKTSVSWANTSPAGTPAQRTALPAPKS